MVELGFSDHKRRGQADRRAVSVLGQHMPPGQRLADVTTGAETRINVNPGPQAARSEREHAATDHAIQPVPQLNAEPGCPLLVVAGLQQSDYCPPDSAGERVATEGAAMLARLQDTKHVMISNYRGQRHDATAQRLTQQVDISRDLLMLHGKGAAGTSNPDWISSAMNSIRCWLDSSRTPAR